METMEGRVTCVVVDDHEAIRDGVRGRLRDAGIRVVGESATLEDGIRVVCRMQPHVALFDLRLPDGDGTTATGVLRERGYAAPVVVYSGAAGTPQAEQVLEAGAAAFVLKDSPANTLVDAITMALDGRRYIDPTLAAELLPGGNARRLSSRERQILSIISDGGQNAAIAYDLGISVETVKAHVSNILGKLDASSRTHAVAKALREGIIE